MVNNIDLRDSLPPMPAFGGGGSAEEYSDYYMEHMYPELLRRACHPIFFGEGLGGVAVDVAGIEGVRGWDMAALVKAMVETEIYLDFVTVDGAEGGTGAAPAEFSEEYPLCGEGIA